MSTSQLDKFCPYKGLQPYEQHDQTYFFGRERDTEIITANLHTAPLTVLYGASGVGKSSVLLAGVVPVLEQTPRVVVVVFREWQSPGYLTALKDKVLAAVREKNPQAAIDFDAGLPLDKFLKKCSRATRSTIFLVLDQFEEYFLYHPVSTSTEEFDAEFARAVNRQEINANFLLAMRDDGLSKLDRFQARIPGIMGNLLRLEHLERDAAEDAIRKPLDKYNGDFPEAKPFRIETPLVERLLEDLKAGKVTLDLTGQGQVSAQSSDVDVEQRIETPFLQMVLTRLWDEEQSASSHALRLATYTRLGGATPIVRSHLDKVMEDRLASDDERDVAANLFHYLVTPGGMKIAHTLNDLASYTGESPARVSGVIKLLSDSNVRIVRPVAAPLNQHAEDRFEIFHDVLAPAILDWRARFIQRQAEAKALEEAQEREAKALAEAQQRLNREREEAERLAAEQRQRLQQAQERAELERQRAEAQALRVEAELQRAEEQKRRAQAEQLRAEEQERRAEVERLRAEEQERLAKAEYLRAEEHVKSSRRLLRLVAALVIMILLAIGTTVFAFEQRSQARANETRAKENAVRAEISEKKALKFADESVEERRKGEEFRQIGLAAQEDARQQRDKNIKLAETAAELQKVAEEKTARALVAQKNVADALEKLTREQRLSSDRKEASARSLDAQTIYRSGDKRRAVAEYEKTFPLFERTKDLRGLANVHYKVAEIYKELSEEDEPEAEVKVSGFFQDEELPLNQQQQDYANALKNFERARQLYGQYGGQTGDHLEEAATLNTQGALFEDSAGKEEDETKRKESLIKSVGYYAQALSLYKEREQRSGAPVNEVMDTLKKLAGLSDEIDPPAAIRYNTELVARYLSHGDIQNAAVTYMAMATLRSASSQYEEALRADEEALKLYRQNTDASDAGVRSAKSGEAATLAQIGDVRTAWAKSNPDPAIKQEALKAYSQSLVLYEAPITLESGATRPLGQAPTRASLHFKLAQLYQDLKETANARDEYDKAIKLLGTSYGTLFNRITVMSWDSALEAAGKFYLEVNEQQKAIDAYSRALELYRRVKRVSEQIDMLKRLGQIYESRGDRTKAAEFYQQAQKLEEDKAKAAAQPDDK